MEKLKRRAESSKPLLVQWAALFAAFVATCAHSLTRVDMTDTPWHLATARLALAEHGFPGAWPTVNTFSYTFPNHPLFQQYPVYQSLLYIVHQLASWEGLSVLHCLLWLLILTLWIIWAGGFAAAAKRPLLWIFVVLGLQQRMVLRPDVLTIPLLVLQLIFLDRYQRSGRYRFLFCVVAVQWVLCNTHQLFTLGLAFQGLFLASTFARRYLKIPGPLPIPAVLPLVVMLTASLLVCLFTPLGTQIIQVPFITADSLASHREHVQEFAYVWTKPYPFGLFLVACVTAITAAIRARGRVELFEAAVLFLSFILALSAWRGLAFFVAAAGAVSQRWIERVAEPERRARRLGTYRLVTLALTFATAIFIVWFRWITPVRNIIGVQPGIGRTIGQWPDGVVSFIKQYPPPGRVLNLSWYTASILIWEFYPQYSVSVDPRFETYPRDFLLTAIKAEENAEVLARLLEKFDPLWLVGELRVPAQRARARELLEQGDWELVAVDPVFFLLVRKGAGESNGYLSMLPPASSRIPLGIIPEPPDLRELQVERLRQFFIELGRDFRKEVT